MSELEIAQAQYISFLTEKLKECESALRTQSWWKGFKESDLIKGTMYRNKINLLKQ